MTRLIWEWIKLFVHCGWRFHRFMQGWDDDGRLVMLACDDCAKVTWVRV